MRLFDDKELFESLKELEVIPQKKLLESFSHSQKEKTPLADLLIEHDLISEANLGKIISDITGFPFCNLSETAIDQKVLKIIPEVYAKKKRLLVFDQNQKGLHIAMNNPLDKEAIEFISKKTGEPVVVYFATKRDLNDALNLYSKDVGKVFDEIISENIQLAEGSKQPDPSIIKIVDTTVSYAYQNKASDIHIEPADEGSVIRFRIDGILHDIVTLPINIHPQIVTRVKVMARLRTDEHQSGQDGKISVKLEDEELDIRVSIVPVIKGEKIVMRLLSERSRQFSFRDMGFSENDLPKIEDAFKKPHGMILSTGPTGSGKTTTLYAILKLLNTRDVNIMTIEDPVEYDIEGINQIQVNQATNLTFAAGLKSIVRQDPDIILVGEIRDQETADISINASLTGHLVLSTLHTNDAATTFPRLIDLGIEPYLIASTINIVIAQRLIRKICVKCRTSEEANKSSSLNAFPKELITKYLGNGKNFRVYKGKGCEVCHNTGYAGREGVFEILILDDNIRSAIIAKKDASDIKKIAVNNGMRSMIENGLEKVKEGITTIEEILRVTME